MERKNITMKSDTREVKNYGIHDGHQCGILYKRGKYLAIPQQSYKLFDTLEEAAAYMAECGLTETNAE
jgi:hypothetical protein